MTRIKSWILGLLAVVLTCFYPCVFLYFQNAGEALPQDMLLFFGLFLLNALAALLIWGVIFRNISRAAVMTCLSMLAVMNFTLITGAIKARISGFRDLYFLVIVAVILLALAILLLKKKPDLTALCAILAITFGALILVGGIQAAPTLIRVFRSSASAPAQVTDGALQGAQPNVYYLLFDEYGGDENLETYFDYDNSDFYAALEERGFSISRSSRNTESCWTDTLVPNLLNLDYVANDEMPELVRREYLEHPTLPELFRSSGYQINLINHRAFLRIQADQVLTHNQTEGSISEYLLENSLYYKIPPLRERLEYYMFRQYRDGYLGPVEDAIDALESCADQVGDGPTLTISYIQCPHAPFVFQADGTPRDATTGWNWKDKTLYPAQLQYVNSVILTTIDRIQAEDPTGVILLLSDHGARVPLHYVEQYGGPRFDAEAETPVMQSTLCCCYIPGVTLDIEGDTGINMTRKVLDQVFDAGLGTIPPAEGYVLGEIYNAKETSSPSSQEK